MSQSCCCLTIQRDSLDELSQTHEKWLLVLTSCRHYGATVIEYLYNGILEDDGKLGES